MIASTQVQGWRWDDVRLFLALYRRRTLAGAGAVLRLDASTLSRRLVGLEKTLRAELFVRTREGLVPTEAAERLLAAAEAMEAAHGRFVREASDDERVPEGVVRLSVPPGLAESFVAPALVELRKKYPRLVVVLDASTQFVDLSRQEADVAIRTQRPRSGDLVSVKVGERKWAPMVAKRRADAEKPTHAWSDVPWITWADDLEGFPPARWVAKHVRAEAVVLRTNHFPTQVAAVEAGLGAALLPPVYARLVAVVPVQPTRSLRASMRELPTSETWLVGHRALRTVPRVDAVWSFLLEKFRVFETT